MKNLFKFFLPLFAIALTFNACLDEDFDNPPVEGSVPDIEADTTIAELKAMHTLGTFTDINDDLIVKGIVVADDFSGNWYRSFVIQDETAGITVLVDITESYVFYPEGREIFIKLNGLALNDYNNLIQVGVHNRFTNELDDIANVSDHLVKSVKRTAPTPKLLTINQLSLNDVGRLVQLDEVYFPNIGTTFADAAGQNTVNIDLSDCNGNLTIVRTSGFADFASQLIPEGGGTFVGILSVFGDTYQLLVRSPDDLDMGGDRCGSGPGGNGCDTGSGPLVVSGVEEDFENGSDNNPVAINGWTNVAVTGGRTWQYKEFSGNTYAQATAYQDNAANMETWMVTPLIDLTEPQVLTFESAQAFYTHDGMTVWVSTDYDCDPTTATWVPLNANLAGPGDDNYEFVPSGDIDLSALVGEKIAIGFKYVGSGPSGQTGSFIIDNLKLGEGGGGPPTGNCPTVDEVNEDFSGGANNDDVSISGWENVAFTGDRNWIYKEFDGNVYVQATAFNDAAPQTGSWLVTPPINVDGPKTLTFETAKAFWTHDGLTVWTSTDYDCNPLTATWQPLNANLAGQSDADHEWVPSGAIDLSAFMGGKVAIGFKYEGNNNAGETASYRVDNLVVE